MIPAPVAGRFVSWALVFLGAAEVVWVVYLVFNQVTSGMGYHLQFAAIGMDIAIAVLSALALWALLTRRPSAAPLCIAAATVTGFGALIVTLSPNLQAGPDALWHAVVPLAMAVAGAVAAVLVAVAVFRGTADPRGTLMRVCAVVLALTVLFSAVRFGQHVLEPQTTALVQRTRGIVVFLDTGETIGLLGAGIASLRRRPTATLVFAVIGASLLTCDAFLNVVTVASGEAFAAAIFYLLVGEIPSTVLCLIAARAAYRQLRGRAAEHGQTGMAGAAA